MTSMRLMMVVCAALLLGHSSALAEPAHHAAARAFLRVMFEGPGVPVVTEAKPIQFKIDHGRCARDPKKASGTAKTSAAAKELKACLEKAKADFPDKVDAVAATDVKPAAFLKGIEEDDREDAKAMIKDGLIVSFRFGGSVEKLTIHVIVGKSGAVTGVWVTAHAA